MTDLEENDGGLCARNRCTFVILALGLALVAAPAPMGYGADANAATTSVVSGIIVWVCALASLVGQKRSLMALCGLSGIAVAAAPWMAAFANMQNAAFVHGAAGSAIAVVALAALIMSTPRASVPVRA